MKNLKPLLFCFFLIGALSSSLFYGCTKDKTTTPPATKTPDAKITGTVKSPTGQIIGGAQIIADPYKTVSDKNGFFSLNVYHGTYQLIIQTGNGKIFQSTVNVTVAAGDSLPLAPSQTVLEQVGSLAYIKGNWDNIQTIIIDSLGYTATEILVSDITNDTLMAGYDALFLNCGAAEYSITKPDSLTYLSLLHFLQNHGSIYASDYAVEFLTGYGYSKMAFMPGFESGQNSHTGNGDALLSPCQYPHPGGFIPDSCLCTSKNGSICFVENALILDTAIINLLGHDTIDIEYNLGSWEVIYMVSTPMNPIITDLTWGPLAVKSDPFCDEYGGIIFYTTFHNEAQGDISQDVKKILQYFILNL